MPTTITLSSPDSAQALAAMVSALESEGALDEYQEMVAQKVIEDCAADMTNAALDDLDEEVAAIRERL